MLIGANRKTLCINRVLISLLPRYSIMKHTAYFCRKFGRQLFLVVTEQAGVESQHFPPMMKNCYDIRKMSNFVWEGIFVSQAFYTGFQLSIVESAKAAAVVSRVCISQAHAVPGSDRSSVLFKWIEILGNNCHSKASILTSVCYSMPQIV